MKHQNITLSFPSDLHHLLQTKVPRRGISKFVAEAVRKALLEEENQQQQELEKAYEAATQDKERNKIIEEWKVLDEEEGEWEW